jgi:hypothetical protein
MMFVEEYVLLEREEIIKAEYTMVELNGFGSTNLNLDLNQEVLDEIDLDEQLLPIIKFC